MKFIKSNGKKRIKISKKEWNTIGEQMGWTKTAGTFEVYYSPSFKHPKLEKTTLTIRPSEIPPGMSEEEYMDRRIKKRFGPNAYIDRAIPKSSVSRKKGPSKKDLQRQRGEKQRKEREKRLNEKRMEEWKKKKIEEYNLPKDASLEMIELFEQVNQPKEDQLDNLLNQPLESESIPSQEDNFIEELRKLKKK